MSEPMVCAEHGPSPPTVVCAHLAESASSGLGFVTAFEPEYDRPTAWCRSCERVRAACDGWTDEADAEAAWIAICSACYERVRARNLPSPFVQG